MSNDLQPTANDLIRALGVLAVAQERQSDADEVNGLTRHAIHLKEALEISFQPR